ncbi:low-complexity tail membrane protein [Synechococcus sp. RSCCF101]|nr:low-complexity tail membrane protein [Synechococcus sp. RSCCF101]
MTVSPASPSLSPVRASREDPLIWLQLLGPTIWPLETLLLLLVLANDGPVGLPALERLFAWGIGAVLPATLLWRMPPSPFSLLLIQRPEQALSAWQQRLLRPDAMPRPVRVLAAAGLLPLLALLSRIDGMAPQAFSWSPFRDSPRLLGLLLAAGLLAVMLWQWQQWVQALWLLTRGPSPGSEEPQPGTPGFDAGSPAGERLSLGLPLLLLQPLSWARAAGQDVAPQPAPEDSSVEIPPGTAGVAVAVPPEQRGEEEEGAELQEQIAAGDLPATEQTGEHDHQADGAGASEGEPEPPPESPPGGA